MRDFRGASLWITLLCFFLFGCSGTKTNAPALTAGPQPDPPVTGGQPSGTTAFDNIQQAPGWQTCGNCGNSGAAGATATYSMAQGITSPAESGASAEFSIGGPYPYTNAYWYYRHPARSTAMSSLVYQFDIYIPTASENAPQAIEFECQQRLDGYIYNFAWQADYASNQWRFFNYTAKQWEASGIALQRFAGGGWHHIIAEYHNDAVAHTTYHDAFTIDSTRHVVNAVHAATATTTQGNDFTNAFQLDLNGAPVPYQVYVDQMRVAQVD